MRPNIVMALVPFGGLFAPTIAMDTQITWGAVVFTMNGELEPSLYGALDPYLTSVGATQAQNAGSVIRSRYIENTTTAGFPGNATQFAYIQGIRSDVVDNSQLYVLSSDDEGVINSATAFAQGLYPPVSFFERDTQTRIAGDAYVQYPLGGYQYVNVESASSLDWNQIWVDGTANCIDWDIAANDYYDSVAAAKLKAGTAAFYQSLNSIVFSPLGLPNSQLTYTNAYNLYQYAAYQYAHNTTVRSSLPASDLSLLRILASQQQYSIYGNLTATSKGATTATKILAIAGKTLAYKTYTALNTIINSGGSSTALNLIFGSYKPFLSFFSLASLSKHSSGQNIQFQSLPEPGSMMVFELFSVTVNTTATTIMPNEDQLWVRFLFRNGTDESQMLQSYPLFDRGNSMTDMTWSEFKEGMVAISAGTGVASWCQTCGYSAIWCPLFEDLTSDAGGSSSGSGSSGSSDAASNGGMTPRVAGIVGAIVTLSVVLLALLAAIFIGGLRFSKRERARGSSLGGFKGAEKMKSDVDVSVVGSGDPKAAGTDVRHMRVGSWELGESPLKKGPIVGTDKDEEAGIDRIISTADYGRDDDAHSIIDPFGDPVKVDDRV